ncbi:MAG: hypothetical protein J6X00_00365 [Clostridia bacterium]|nr:hypothetical protein [Clostridia bacterium]
MKSATKTMYLIGKIFTIIEMVCAAICSIFAIIAISASQDVYNQAISDGYSTFESPAHVKAVGITMLVVMLLVIAVQIVVLVLAKRARKSIEKDEKNTTPHIVMIVVGVFSNIFYLLGGVFGVLTTGDKE